MPMLRTVMKDDQRNGIATDNAWDFNNWRKQQITQNAKQNIKICLEFTGSLVQNINIILELNMVYICLCYASNLEQIPVI